MGLFNFKKKKQNDDEVVATPEEVGEDTEIQDELESADEVTEPGDETSEPEEEKKESGEKKKLTKEEKKKLAEEKKKAKELQKKIKYEEKFLPHEDEEDKNPEVRLYNQIVRHAWTYSQERFEHNVPDGKRLCQIFRYVQHDYPELFWLSYISYNQNSCKLVFRCLDSNGNFDKKQVEQKRDALRKAARQFTRGISKKTDPYEALITIYRRLILTLDYDGVRLKNDNVTFNDPNNDDVLRSLYSALVEHKVVCAGYAVAMQYLLQSVGISSAFVVSESSGNSCHAFNALKIGKYCYYLDATWGDMSNTLTNGANKNDIFYDYCCVPFEEFILTPKGQENLHTPRKEYYPEFEELHYVTHEYFRHIGAYLKVYDEDKLVDIFANAATNYDEKEMGRFMVGFRCVDYGFRDYVVNKVLEADTFNRILTKAREKVGRNKKALRVLDRKFVGALPGNAPTAYFIFGND